MAMPTNETEVETLITESWRILNSLVMTGEAKLSNGNLLKPSAPALIRTIQDVSKLRPPKRRLIAKVEDFRIAETAKREE
jgi:hypothetical protein